MHNGDSTKVVGVVNYKVNTCTNVCEHYHWVISANPT